MLLCQEEWLFLNKIQHPFIIKALGVRGIISRHNKGNVQQFQNLNYT